MKNIAGFNAMGVAFDASTGRDICQRCWNGAHEYTGHNAACKCLCRDVQPAQKPAKKRNARNQKPEQLDIASAYGTVRV